MAEYIEREPLIKVLKKWCDDAAMGDNEYAYSLADDLLNEVNAQPAVDIDRYLNKQIPKKPYIRIKLGEKMVIGTCPTCGDGGNSEYPYCGKCGQALDWSDEA